jgi:hypothetical protein
VPKGNSGEWRVSARRDVESQATDLRKRRVGIDRGQSVPCDERDDLPTQYLKGNVWWEEHRRIPSVGQPREAALDVRQSVNGNDDRFDRERTDRGLECAAEVDSIGVVRIVEEANARRGGCDLFQSLEHLAEHGKLEKGKAGDVAARPRHAFHPANTDRIARTGDNDRDGARELHQYGNDAPANSDDDIRVRGHQTCRFCPHAIHVVDGPALVKLDISAFRPSQFCQLLSKCANAAFLFAVVLGIGIKIPTRRIPCCCCARAVSGHATAVPPTRVMKSRRFTGRCVPCFRPKG